MSTGGTFAVGGGYTRGSFDKWSDRGGALIKGWDNTPNNSALQIVNSGDTTLLRMRNSGELGIGMKYPDTNLSVSGEVNTQVVTVTGNTTLNGALSVSGLTSFVGDSRFNEDVTIGGGLTITASTYPGTALFRADDNIVVIWPSKVGIGPVPLTISGTTNISGDTTIDGILRLNSSLEAGGEDSKIDLIGGMAVSTFLTGDTMSATSVHASRVYTLDGRTTVDSSDDTKTDFGDDTIISEIKGSGVKINSVGNIEAFVTDGKGLHLTNAYITGSTIYSANTSGNGVIAIPAPSKTFTSGTYDDGYIQKICNRPISCRTRRYNIRNSQSQQQRCLSFCNWNKCRYWQHKHYTWRCVCNH